MSRKAEASVTFMEIVSESPTRSVFVLRLIDRFFDRRSPIAISREGNLLPAILSVGCVYACTVAYVGYSIPLHSSHGRGGSEIWIELTPGGRTASTSENAVAKPIPQAKPVIAANVVEKAKAPNQRQQPFASVRASVRHAQDTARAEPDNQSAKPATSPALAERGTAEATSGDGAVVKDKNATTQATADQPAQTPNSEPAQTAKAAKTGADTTLAPPLQAKTDAAARPPLIAMGNIAPYRREVLTRIAHNWHPKHLYSPIVLLITIDRAGRLIDSEVLTSSGNGKADGEAINAAKNTEFSPLPDWFQGHQLKFKIELASREETG